MPPRKGNMILKVDRQGFLMVPISGQKVMIKMGQCHLKHGLTFARAPCKLYFDGKKASPLLTKIFMQLKGKVTVPRV